MFHWFPPNVSTFGADLDFMFLVILGITGTIFVLVEAALVYFVIKYRHREGRRAVYVHGNTKLEVIWTAIPFAIVVVIAVMSMGPWLRARDPARFPPAGLTVEVTAKQFEWNAKYPGPDNVLGTADDFTTRNRLTVPGNRPVHVVLRAEDVIHSFFLPELRVKQDAVPGMAIPIWFEATRPGEYVIGCAELCGLGHYRMRGSLIVLDGSEFDSWNASGGQAGVAAVSGTPVALHQSATGN